MRKISVSIRLGLVFGIIIFFTVAISYVYLGDQLRALFYDGIKNELYKNLQLNRQLLEERPSLWDDIAQSDRWADDVGAALDLRVTLISLDGGVIGDSYIPADRLPLVENHIDRPEIRQALDEGFGESTRLSGTVKENMLYVAVPLGSEKPFAVLRFAKPLHDIRLLEAELRKGIEGALFWSLLLSLIFGSLTAVLLARPLRRISDAAENILHGDYSMKLEAKSDDEVGQLARAFNFISDEMKRMNQQEEWFKAVFSSIREAIIVTDSKGMVMLANPAACRLFNLDCGEMIKTGMGRKVNDSQLIELFENVRKEGAPVVKKEIAVSTERGERMLQMSAVPVIKDNLSEGTVFVLNDITKLRNLERMRRDFVSSVSHELRTPLTSIRGYTETLLEGAMHDPENASHFLQIILKESEQLTALINDVLDLSKIESGRIEYRFRPVDIREIARKTVGLFSRAIEKKGIDVSFDMPDDLADVRADGDYIELAVRNLVDNAIKYVPEANGRIRIFASGENDMVRFGVEDNGAGIPRKDLDRIFERFYRVDKARSRQVGGTGLGLSIVKHIVLAHNGRVEVRSKVNLGSVFSFTVPVVRNGG
ncbi:PAS domain-containing sensor histidine kinase [Prosthecochloris sp. GSB1]|uniref:ATP-binding protein n=1 Tax=Prosthecochloris sp. GSB1 TaxID=281093 RepID=UPI000B8D1B93|nr:ATP-binding protein [Prosthecochloris sp. GSB1]ASQ90793.1 PAS domain-containing sensor histidine kinase [Prosthecochloris sp. GSB1]